MAKATNIVKRKPGRPVEIDATEFVALRLPTAQLKRIDAWAAANGTQRSGAIRQLVELGLAARRRGRSDPGREESAKIAGKTIDALADQSVPVEERAKRKRRLVKGPNEFREIRDDQPEARGPRR
jgi:hypothetical protein